MVSSPELLADIVPPFEDLVATLLAAAAAVSDNSTLSSSTLSPYLVYQPIPLNALNAMQKNGGNALGLSPAHGPLMLVQISMSWDDAGLDELVENNVRLFIETVDALAAEKGQLKGFVYMNFAGMK